MLAQSFKTAEDLGIKESQFEALKKVLVLLETGKLVHSIPSLIADEDNLSFSGHFSMATWQSSIPCGTVACIGGTAELLGAEAFSDTDHRCGTFYGNKELKNLFYPNLNNYNDITPEQAAVALRSYLTTGYANWETALAKNS